jgi:tetratricopeptide (TPR) repeat protein
MKELSPAIQQGKHLVEQLQLAEAASYFETLLTQPGEEKDARIWLARLALMADDFTTAESLLEIVLGADPANAEALALQGILYIKQGQFEKAAGVLEAARRYDPKLAMVYPNLALVYRELQRLRESVKAATRGVQLLPDDPQAHLEAARTFWAMNQPQPATSQALRALELDPLYLFAYLDLGGWLVVQGRAETAIELYLEGIRHAPDAWPLREQLAGLYLFAEQPAEAVVHARFLAEHRGISTDYLLLGDCLAAAGEVEDAESVYKQALTVDSDNWEAHLRLAELYRAANLLPEAEVEYRAAASGADSYVPLNELGLFLLHQSQFEEAATVLNEALQLDSSRQESRLNLALCYAALERKAEAEDLARQVSANSPKGGHLREEADRLVAAVRQAV